MGGLIYFLPGRGAFLDGNLGKELLSRDNGLIGRAFSGDFAQQSFKQQIEIVVQDLSANNQAIVIAHSFGAYLLLHAILEMTSVSHPILLISPILGGVKNRTRWYMPPRHKAIEGAIDNEEIPKLDLTIIVGEEDWQSPISLNKKLCQITNGQLVTIADSGHRLDPIAVKKILDKWLPQ